MPEVGGIFIGCLRGADVDISACTGPGPADVSAPFSFIRNDPSHQDAVTKAWSSSGQTDTFVGEWHTHPFGAPRPSSIDRSTWQSIARANRRPMISAIVCPDAWQLFVTHPIRFFSSTSVLVPIESGQFGLVFSTAPLRKRRRPCFP
ncbi:MAG: Mov34/MPN/PAD-1 family protein [Thermohalobaculum sp.]